MPESEKNNKIARFVIIHVIIKRIQIMSLVRYCSGFSQYCDTTTSNRATIRLTAVLETEHQSETDTTTEKNTFIGTIKNSNDTKNNDFLSEQTKNSLSFFYYLNSILQIFGACLS